MFKQILVPVTGTACDAAVFDTALLVARPFAAHLEFLHVRIDSTDVAVAMTAGGVGLDAETEKLVERIEAEDDSYEQKARREVAEFCCRNGIPTGVAAPGSCICADLQVETGREAQCISDRGRFADLIVMGRERPGEHVAVDLLEAALLNTGRPLLVAPAQPPSRLLETIVIAWTDAAEAYRAVAQATPLIDHGGQVVIVSVRDAGTEMDPTMERLQRGLHWHNPNVTARSVAPGDRSPAQALLDTAAELGASLLVMGGYGRNRLLEDVFGSTTSRILSTVGLPVLMAH